MIKDIAGYEGRYQASTSGEIISIIRQPRVLKSSGLRYQQVILTNSEGVRKTYYVHRLIALTFLKGPEKETVDHIDRDKNNNAPSNLRWADRFGQVDNRVDAAGNPINKSTPVVTLTHKDHGSVLYSNSFSKDYGVKSGDIRRVLRGERRSCGGWSVAQ